MIKAIIDNTEYLETTDGDSVPCISIENLSGILVKAKAITVEQAMELDQSV